MDNGGIALLTGTTLIFVVIIVMVVVFRYGNPRESNDSPRADTSGKRDLT